MWTKPIPKHLSGTSVSQRKKPKLRTPKAQTPARTRDKLRTPTLKLRSKALFRSEAMVLFRLLDPALLKPTFPLPQLHLPAVLLPLLLLESLHPKTLNFIRSLVCRVQL
jgi:hypothetical protein